jgi:hypothetical protein
LGIEIQLQDEYSCRIDGVADSSGQLSKLLPAMNGDGSSYALLSGIDPYGDTTFNRIQMPRFLSEWALLISQAQSSEQVEVVIIVTRLAERCADEVHTYLKSIGD